MEKQILARMACVASVLFLSACTTTMDTYEESVLGAETNEQLTLAERLQRNTRQFTPAASVSPGDSGSMNATTVIKGSGTFINTDVANRPPPLQQADGEVTLNFELADIRDVIKIVFDTLGENYVLDPRVQGEVTVQTSRPLPREMLLPTLESLLKANGATLLRTGGVYKILPISEAVRGNSSPRLNTARTGPGYSVRIFPLRYISVTEMQTILQPFAPDGGILLADPVRNLLILAGTSQELELLQETIEIFDVNWLKGMSVGMYVLQNVESQDMAAELDKLFGASSELPLAGLFRFVPIDRLNAILVITPQAEFLTDVSAWIERLDGSGGERLYVYEVQYSDSEYLASLLNQIYEESISSSAASSSSGQVAPNLTPTQIGTTGSMSSGSRDSNNGSGESMNAMFQLSEEEQFGDLSPQSPPPSDFGSGDFGGGNFGGPGAGPVNSAGFGAVTDTVRIIADTENNSLLIWASAQSYDKLLNALRKVDVPKRQVLIEATIAEVTLTDELQYGLRWFFENSLPGSNNTGSGSLNLGNDASLGDVLGEGFTYALTNQGGMVRAVLNLLAQDNKLRVLSSPQLMVIDNQEARINVGREEPVATSSTVGDGGNQSSNFQFRDTGVILEVKPQINAGGLVTLDVSQEVSSALDGETRDFNGIPQPVISQRTINSKVAVQDGQTLVLGGLITEQLTNNQDGIPGLYKLPIVGPLFGNTSRTFDRTELVVLITPKVINDSFEAEQVTNELKERMRGIVPLDSPWKRKPVTQLPKKSKKNNASGEQKAEAN